MNNTTAMHLFQCPKMYNNIIDLYLLHRWGYNIRIIFDLFNNMPKIQIYKLPLIYRSRHVCYLSRMYTNTRCCIFTMLNTLIRYVNYFTLSGWKEIDFDSEQTTKVWYKRQYMVDTWFHCLIKIKIMYKILTRLWDLQT